MHGAVSQPLCVQLALPDDRAEALALVLAGRPAADRARHVAAWADAVSRSQAELWAGYRGDCLAVAMLVQVQPGRTAVVLPPRSQAGEPRRSAAELLTQVAADLAIRGVRLGQALLEPDDPDAAEVLISAGFRHASDLLYLVSLAASFPTTPPTDGLEYVPYATERRDRLAAIIERTYEGSLDCPGLDKVRSIDEVLDGYQGVGVFDPARWLIVQRQGADVGCLLLADHPANNAWEIVYMGVAPQARGRRYGVAIARFAQWLTRGAGRDRLTAAVDAENGPATAAYAEAGFVSWDRRSVFLRLL